MKRKSISRASKWLLFTVLTLSVSKVFAVDLNQDDKNKHAGLAYNLTAISNHSMQQMGFSKIQSAFLAGGTVMLAGLVKESAMDKHIDRQDIEANFYGAALGMIIPLRIEF